MRPCARHTLALLSAVLAVVLATAALAQQPGDPPPPLDELRQTLVGGDVEARLRAVGWLADDPSPDATEALELASLDTAPDVRRLALAALGPRPDVAAAVFAAALGDADPTVRIAALAAAADQPDDPARSALVAAALDDDDRDVRILAAQTLLVDVPTDAWPDCRALAERWRRATSEAPPDPSAVQVLAALTHARTVSASSCGLTEEEYARVAEGARRQGTFMAAPELALAQRSWRARLDEMRYRMLELEDAADFEQTTVCLEPLRIQYGDFFGLAVEAERRIDDAMSSNPGDDAMTRQVLTLLDTLERFLRDTETCFADPDAFQPYGGYGGGYPLYPRVLEPVHSYLFAGLEAVYDDHFLALRDDVDKLRVTDQMSERVVARGQWTSEPRPLDEPITVDHDDNLVRLRGELTGDIYNGESQLSGASGWADVFVDLPFDRDHHAFVVGEGGYDRGWLDRGLPWRLLVPAGWFRTLGGVGFDVHDADVPVFAIAAGLEGQFYDAPDGISPARALSGDSDALGLAPAWVLPDVGDANRLTGDVRARWAVIHDPELGVYLDAVYRVHGYLEGTPTLTRDLQRPRRDPFNHHIRTEAGAWFGDREFLLIAQLGATTSLYPDPTATPTATFTGRLYAEFGEDTRNHDGGRLWFDSWRRVDDAPGLGDALAHSGARGGAILWETESDGVIELDTNVLFEHIDRALLVPDAVLDGEILRGGLTLALNVVFDEAPTLSLSWMVLAEKNDQRGAAYLQSLGEDPADDRALLRNVVMLNLYMALDGASLDLLDARSPEWGFDHMRRTPVPVLWWLEP